MPVQAFVVTGSPENDYKSPTFYDVNGEESTYKPMEIGDFHDAQFDIEGEPTPENILRYFVPEDFVDDIAKTSTSYARKRLQKVEKITTKTTIGGECKKSCQIRVVCSTKITHECVPNF